MRFRSASPARQQPRRGRAWPTSTARPCRASRTRRRSQRERNDRSAQRRKRSDGAQTATSAEGAGQERAGPNSTPAPSAPPRSVTGLCARRRNSPRPSASKPRCTARGIIASSWSARPRRRKEKARRNGAKATLPAAFGGVANARSRYAQALSSTYSFRDPYGSLAAAAMAEYGSFRRQQDALRKEAGGEQDPDKRRLIDLRREIEGHDYMAITSERLAGISRAITMGDNDGAQRDNALAKAHTTMAQEKRQERAELQRELRERAKGDHAATERPASAASQSTARQHRSAVRARRSRRPRGKPEGRRSAIVRMEEAARRGRRRADREGAEEAAGGASPAGGRLAFGDHGTNRAANAVTGRNRREALRRELDRWCACRRFVYQFGLLAKPIREEGQDGAGGRRRMAAAVCGDRRPSDRERSALPPSSISKLKLRSRPSAPRRPSSGAGPSTPWRVSSPAPAAQGRRWKGWRRPVRTARSSAGRALASAVNTAAMCSRRRS